MSAPDTRINASVFDRLKTKTCKANKVFMQIILSRIQGQCLSMRHLQIFDWFHANMPQKHEQKIQDHKSNFKKSDQNCIVIVKNASHSHPSLFSWNGYLSNNHNNRSLDVGKSLEG